MRFWGVTCGEVIVEQTSIDALGHKWDAGVITKQPTETETGIRTYTCQNDKNHTKTEEIAKLPKKSEDVGAIINADAVYVVTVAGAAPEVAFKAPAKKNAKSVTIPATVKMGNATYKVTSIAKDAFKNNKAMTSVKIKANIT